MSNILKLLKIPKDSEAGILINPIITVANRVDFFLESLKLSIKAATVVSIMLIPDVIDAKNKRAKNISPKITPKGS